MRVMMMLRADRNTETGVPPTPEHMAEMGKLVEGMAKAGVLVAADGLQPSARGKRITFSGGRITSVTDGPFTETKELIAGYCIIQVNTWDDVLAWSDRFASIQRDGESELRPMYDQGDCSDQELREELQRKAGVAAAY
jgi:hypothetical protein